MRSAGKEVNFDGESDRTWLMGVGEILAKSTRLAILGEE